MTKTCAICKQDKLRSEFHRNKWKKDGYSSWCKTCTKDYKDRHYRENKASYIEKASRVTTKNKEWLNSLKTNKPCIDCGKTFHPVCMDFDHVRGRKEFNISSGIKDFSREAVIHEIEKCELVCSNCHRLRTFHRKNNLPSSTG